MNIFLDMDGVLVDLYGKIALELFNKPYLELTQNEILNAKAIWRDKKRATIFFNNFGGVESFFANLPEFESKTQQIIEIIVGFDPFYKICSKPAQIDIEASKKGKIRWIKKHLNKNPPSEIILTQNKAKWAISENGQPNILIDDYFPYIQSWENCGGFTVYINSTVQQLNLIQTTLFAKLKQFRDDQI